MYDEGMSKSALVTHAERLEKRLDKIKSESDTFGTRAMNIGEFIGGVALSSGYRAYLNKKGQPMPKIMGYDADTVVGTLMVLGGFFEIIPDGYADHALYLGAGLVSGAVGNKIAGVVNEKVQTKGEPMQLTSGAERPDVSAHRGASIVELIRQSA